MTRSWLRFFDLAPESKGAGCRLCPKALGRESANLIRHLRKRHPSEYAKFVRGASL